MNKSQRACDTHSQALSSSLVKGSGCGHVREKEINYIGSVANSSHPTSIKGQASPRAKALFNPSNAQDVAARNQCKWQRTWILCFIDSHPADQQVQIVSINHLCLQVSACCCST